MARWNVKAQVGGISYKNPKLYSVNLAENSYVENADGAWSKEWVIWFNCICFFKPIAEVGDTVMAEGYFIPSKNEGFPYTMVIKHMGIIKHKNHKDNE